MSYYTRFMRLNALKEQGDRSAALDLARSRLIVLYGFFAILYILLGLRVLDLGILQARYGDAPDTGQVFHAAEDRRRGAILDRNGRMIASSIAVPALFADPKLISNPKVTAEALLQIFPTLNSETLQSRLKSQKRFVWIARQVTPKQQKAIMNIGEPGLQFRDQYTRVYPQKNAAMPLAGLTDVDGQGLSGIERQFDTALSKGEDVTLTLDVRLQHAVRKAVQKAIGDFNAKGGAGLIMDVHTGEVLAGVSLPDANPHDRSGAHPTNKLTASVYELGSVFKVFSTAAYLEAHADAMDHTFDARAPLKIGRFTISDYHAQERELTLPEVFVHSSNIGSSLMAQSVGAQSLKNLYTDLGLLHRPVFDIAETAAPLTPERWGAVQTMTAAYGHGIAVSPLQVTSALGSIANGGYHLQPTLIQKDKKQKNPIRIISENTARILNQLMHLSVESGTAGKARVSGYAVGGKTGTAEKSEGGRYAKNKLISSFAGIFPADAPRYAIFVMVDEPVGNAQSSGYATAGWVAAPAVADIVGAMVRILDIPASPAPSEPHPLQHYLKEAETE